MKNKIITYVAIVLGFLVLSYAFVPQVLSDKIVNQSDISGWKGMAQELKTWNAAHPDDPTAWTGSMFSGMPTAAIEPSTEGDATNTLYNLLMTGKRPANWLFVSMLGAFLLLLSLGVSPLIAAGGAIAVTFCSYNMQIIQVGHNTKMQAIALLPWVLAALIFSYRSAIRGNLPRMLLGGALFGLAVSFQVKANHPQISYYLAVIIVCYVVTVFITLLRKNRRREDDPSQAPPRGAVGRFFLVSFLLLALGLVGIGTNGSKLLPTVEYTPYSMRGGTSSGETSGLDIDYATRGWSYGVNELPNLMIPNYNGGASAGNAGPASETYRLLVQNGYSPKEAGRLPFYWGPQRFTAGPMYMGAITIFLFLLGLFCCKGKERWWLLAASLFAVLLALGEHLMFFTDLAFRYLPLYNKFRTVSMALIVLQFTLPMLGFIALDKVVKGDVSRETFRKKGTIALALTAGFCLLVWLIPGIAGDFRSAGDAGMPDALVNSLVADRKALLRSDALVSMLLITVSYLLLLWSYSEKAAPNGFGRKGIAALGICLLVLVSMFSIGKRYLNASHFTSPRDFNAQFKQRPVDKQILADPDPSYRVLDLTADVFNDSHPSYWHKNIGGYSPAKLQLYQEYIDKHLSGEISALYRSLKDAKSISEAGEALPELEGLSKLNCRYIIIGENTALRYPYAKGTAWFEEDPAGSVTMTGYAPNELRYRYSSPAGGKLVFSEVYYPAGWHLTVDGGQELPITLSDEVLRSAVVPAGEHELVMRFAPDSYSRGTRMSRICSWALILLALAAAGFAVVRPGSGKK